MNILEVKLLFNPHETIALLQMWNTRIVEIKQKNWDAVRQYPKHHHHHHHHQENDGDATRTECINKTVENTKQNRHRKEGRR